MRCTSSCLTKTPEGCGRPVWSSRVGLLEGGEGRGQQHTAEHADEVCPSAQILDAPCAADGRTASEFSSHCLTRSHLSSRLSTCPRPHKTEFNSVWWTGDLRHTQMTEQLMEVPTILSLSLLQQQRAEQTVDNPVPRRSSGGWRRSSRSFARTGFNSADRAEP